MKRRTLLIASLLSVFAAVPALAAEEAVEPIQSGVEASPTSALQPAPTALDLRIAAIREGGVARVQELASRLAVVGAGSAEVLEINREIRQAKLNTEISVLGAILADARENGDAARATEAELAIDRLLHPEKYAAAPVPSGRPAPQQN
jgi:hypothetical protein